MRKYPNAINAISLENMPLGSDARTNAPSPVGILVSEYASTLVTLRSLSMQCYEYDHNAFTQLCTALARTNAHGVFRSLAIDDLNQGRYGNDDLYVSRVWYSQCFSTI